MGVTSFLGESYKAGVSFLKGMGITFREMMFQEPITVQYPEVRDEIPHWFRGIPLQRTDIATGEYKCTSCGMCVEACPVNVITLEWHQNPVTKKKEVDRYAIDMSRCMLCNYCVEACPFDSLIMGSDFELAKVDPENMVFEFEDLLRMGLKYSVATDPNAKKDKNAMPSWVFGKHTGATEADIQDPEGYLGRPPIDPKIKKAKEEEAKKKAEEAAAAASAQATITKDTPTQTPPGNAHPSNVSAEAGPANLATPKADSVDGKEGK